MSADLPQEVLFNIFLKLPLKSLILSSCVSKSWHSIITSPIFISTHLNQTTTHSEKCLILKQKYHFSLHFDSETLDLYQELKFPFSNTIEDFKVVGVCNGLLCLSGLKIFLWNPSIQKSVGVPWISDIFTICGTVSNYALGFGFDSCANDYKVVRLLYFEDKNTLFSCKRAPIVEVFELSTGSWRAISNKAPRCETIRSEWTQAFVNGAVHWVAFRENVKGYKCFILRFHIVDECFSVIGLPECLVNCSPYNLKVGVLGGTLSVVLCDGYCFEMFVSSVWVMEKYGVPESWTKSISFDPSQGFGMVLGCRENGDLLMTSKSGEVVLYKPENQLVKGLGICGTENSFYLDTYVESLVLLKGKKFLEKMAEVDDWLVV